MAASRSAAVSALQMVSGSENHIGPLEVVIIGFKRRQMLGALMRWILVHGFILS
jgi:hypothetical protein